MLYIFSSLVDNSGQAQQRGGQMEFRVTPEEKEAVERVLNLNIYFYFNNTLF